jgi:hypothetical protein
MRHISWLSTRPPSLNALRQICLKLEKHFSLFREALHLAASAHKYLVPETTIMNVVFALRSREAGDLYPNKIYLLLYLNISSSYKFPSKGIGGNDVQLGGPLFLGCPGVDKHWFKFMRICNLITYRVSNYLQDPFTPSPPPPHPPHTEEL